MQTVALREVHLNQIQGYKKLLKELKTAEKVSAYFQEKGLSVPVNEIKEALTKLEVEEEKRRERAVYKLTTTYRNTLKELRNTMTAKEIAREIAKIEEKIEIKPEDVNEALQILEMQEQEEKEQWLLSEEMERIEKDFYQFNPDVLESKGLVYVEGALMALYDLDFLNGYEGEQNHSFINITTIAKILSGENVNVEKIAQKIAVRETINYTNLSKKTIQEILDKPEEELTRKEKEVIEIYNFVKNLTEKELNAVMEKETMEERELTLKEEVTYLSEEERKAVSVVKENIHLYQTMHLPNVIVEEALKQRKHIGEKVEIREHIFEKRYTLAPVMVVREIERAIQKAVLLEKKQLLDIYALSKEESKELEDTYEYLRKLIDLDPENTLYTDYKGNPENTRERVKKEFYKALMFELYGGVKLSQLKPSLYKKMAEKLNTEKDDIIVDYDRIQGVTYAYIKALPINILTYEIQFQEMDPIVKALIKARFKELLKEYEKANNKEEFLTKNNINEISIKFIRKLLATNNQ